MADNNKMLRGITQGLNDPRHGKYPRITCAFTLAEVLISLGIAAIVFAGLITAYIQSSYRAEWSGYSLAAQSLAIQQLEQARAADWDINTIPAKNEITNVPPVTSAILDLPVSGTNVIWATNYTTITSIPITNTVGASVYMVRVDTAWPFIWGGKRHYYTNTVADLFAPD
jgi:type II secretory pathway pseudopilin PulG